MNEPNENDIARGMKWNIYLAEINIRTLKEKYMDKDNFSIALIPHDNFKPVHLVLDDEFRNKILEKSIKKDEELIAE
jgi:hypothetical protein